ncbi:hypothetical protein Plhal304r1_c070g0159181 [Plasmopara halstedii]
MCREFSNARSTVWSKMTKLSVSVYQRERTMARNERTVDEPT